MENPEIDIMTMGYEGCYGPDNFTDIPSIFTMIKCGNYSENIISENKEIIFVIDLNYSSNYDILHIGASLKAFRDFIIQDISDSEIDERTPENLKKHIKSMKRNNFKIIGHNVSAFQIYPQGDCFLEYVIDNNFVRDEKSNIEESIELAYSIKDKNKCTWIVVVTDGLLYDGKNHITKKSLISLKEKAPKNSKIITLGYGKYFDSEALTLLGNFTYIDSIEKIFNVFGSIANEFKYSWGFKSFWKLNNRNFKVKFITGNPRIGCLYQQRQYVCGMTVVDPKHKEEFVKMLQKGIKISFKFIFIQDMKEKEIVLNVKKSSKFRPPELLREKYYDSAKGRRIKRLITSMKIPSLNYSYNKYICKEIKEYLNSWTEYCSQTHKKEILEIIQKIENMINLPHPQHDCRKLRYDLENLKVSCVTQCSNIDERYYTLSQTSTIEKFRKNSKVYLDEKISDTIYENKYMFE